MDKSALGKFGEDLACGYLVNKHYQIIKRNLREKFGEIDIIAKSPDKTLVFFEVKTIRIPSEISDGSPASYPHLAGLTPNDLDVKIDDKFNPEDQMSFSKIYKFKKICQWYANSHPELTNGANFRLDVIAIDFKPGRSIVRHYKNI